MIRYTIKKLDSTYLDHGDFESEEAALAWFSPRMSQGVYGTPSSSYQNLVSEEIPAELDENEEEISPAVAAVYETIEVSADFQVEIVDITGDKEQDATNSSALQYLASTDWYVTRFSENGTAIPSEVTSARDSARLSVVR